MGKTFLGKMQNRNWSWATAYIQPEGIVELINGQNIRVYQRDENGDIVNCSGTVTVTAAGVGFAKSCTYRKTDVVAGTPALYENIGTNTSCDFNLVSAISPGEIAVPEGQTLIGNSSGVAAATSAGAITYKSLSAGATGVVLTGYHDSASPAASDVPFSIVGQGEDSAGNTQVYGKMDFVITDATSTTEDGDIIMSVVRAGTVTQQLQLDSDLNGALVGDGAGAAVLSSKGAQNMVLATNSGTNSGFVTIVAGANGTISLAPNGAGTIEIGGTAGTGDITVGSSSANQTVFISNGTGVAQVSLANGSVAGANVSMASTATGNGVTDTVTISGGNAAGTGIKVVNILTGTPATGGNNRLTMGGGATSAVTVNAAFTSGFAMNRCTGSAVANAPVATLTNASGSNVSVLPGLRITLTLASTLQAAGANTLNLNGSGAIAIKSHYNEATDIGTAYAATGVVELLLNAAGTAWLDLSQ